MNSSYREGIVDIEFTKNLDEHTFRTNLTIDADSDISAVYIALDEQADFVLNQISD